MRKRPSPKATPSRTGGQPRPTRPSASRAPVASRGDTAVAHVVALDVVRESSATGEPADRLLRARLFEAKFPPEVGALAARLVFSWFRWRGFLEDPTPELAALARTLKLAERFAVQPGKFDAADLLEGAVPAWLHQQMTVSETFVRALQREPDVWLRARPRGARAVELQLSGAHIAGPAALPEALRYTGEADLFRHPLFNDGRVEIQDIASQAVGAICAPKPGETWWDACAGEGGKTLHLADQMQNRGLIWASDRSAARLTVLRKRAARAGLFNYRAVSWEGGARPPTRTRFDGVLVDAPCSGVGTWQRNPHARWTVGPVDVSELAAIQARLLETAATAVKPGGRLIYAVCTLTRDETTAVAGAFSRAHPEFEPAPFADPFFPGRQPAAQVLWEPQHTAGNGMFVAAWRRVSR